MGCPKEKVSFTVNDSSVSGKKEILRDGVHVYSQISSKYTREIIYRDTLYSLTLDYYTSYMHHVIHIQVLQRKGVMSVFSRRVFRLFIDGVNFELLPPYFRQERLPCSSKNSSSSISFSSISLESTNHSSDYSDCSQSREMGCNEVSVKNLPPRKYPQRVQQYRTPVWLIGRNF